MSVLSIESSEEQFFEVLSGESPPASSHLEEVDCEFCGKNDDSDDIPIVPEINGDIYRLELKSSGRFCCSATGIKFEVTRPVTLEYELESWNNYMKYLSHGGSEVLGPLFKVTTPLPPHTVSAVYLPHYMCLKKFRGDKSWIRCAHFKDGNLSVETPTRILPFHVVLENPSFSSLGIFLWNLLPLMLTKRIPIHGKVFLYFRAAGMGYSEYKVHLYLMPSFAPVKEAFHRRKARNGFRKIDKPPRTTRTVYIQRDYTVNGPAGAEISPGTLQVDCSSPEVQNYADITISAEVQPIYLQLVNEDNTQIWRCHLSRGELEELVQQFNQNTGFQGVREESRPQISQNAIPQGEPEELPSQIPQNPSPQEEDEVEDLPIPKNTTQGHRAKQLSIDEPQSRRTPFVPIPGQYMADTLLIGEEYDRIHSQTAPERMRRNSRDLLENYRVCIVDHEDRLHFEDDDFVDLTNSEIDQLRKRLRDETLLAIGSQITSQEMMRELVRIRSGQGEPHRFHRGRLHFEDEDFDNLKTNRSVLDLIWKRLQGENLLTRETYEIIRSQITSQESLREILRIRGGQGEPDRNHKQSQNFLDELREDARIWLSILEEIENGLDDENLLTNEDTIYRQTTTQDPMREHSRISMAWQGPPRVALFLVPDPESDESSQESDSESEDLNASSSKPKKHFVDEHREALINGVSLVAPILDSLMSADLLTVEEYQTIMNERTSFDQMRRLYDYARVWNDTQKDVFYEALKKHKRVLLENLERPQP